MGAGRNDSRHGSLAPTQFASRRRAVQVWGLAYLSVCTSYRRVPYLILVFAFEKLYYTLAWIHLLAAKKLESGLPAGEKYDPEKHKPLLSSLFCVLEPSRVTPDGFGTMCAKLLASSRKCAHSCCFFPQRWRVLPVLPVHRNCYICASRFARRVESREMAEIEFRVFNVSCSTLYRYWLAGGRCEMKNCKLNKRIIKRTVSRERKVLYNRNARNRL